MTDIYLDLSDQTEMINFLSKWIEFSSGKIKQHADSYITDYDNGKEVDVVELANLISEYARSIYPARYALNKFFNDSGAGDEWTMTEKAVRRSTAHLLSRFKSLGDVHSLDELMEHDEFDISFSDEDKMEIQSVRHHVWEDYWQKNKNSLQSYVDEGESALKVFEDWIVKLRDCAAGLPALLQEELYSKITRFEDRVLYEAEVMDEKVLTEEWEYYQSQKEVPV
jgi:hypothetical protein